MNKAYDRASRSTTERFLRETADPEVWLNFIGWPASTNKLDHNVQKKYIWECLSVVVQVVSIVVWWIW